MQPPPTPAPSPKRSRSTQAAWALIVTSLLLSIGALHVVEYVPTHDGPQHIYVAHIMNHYSDVGAPYADYYVTARPLSALGFTLFFAPLEEALGWRAASRLTMTLIVLLWGAGAVAIVRAIRPARLPLAALGFVLGFQWALYMGFFSYVLATAMGLLAVALGLRKNPWTVSHRFAIGGLLTLLALLHVFAALTTALVLVTVVASRHPPKLWLKELGLLALMGLPTMLLVAHAAGLTGGGTVDVSARSAVQYASVWDRVLLLRSTFVGGPWWRGWPIVVMMFGNLGLTSLRWRRGRVSDDERGLFLAGVALVALFFVMPFDLPGWQFFAPRFLPIAAAVLLPLLPWEALSSSRQWSALALIGAFVLGSLGWTTWFHLDLAARTSDVTKALRAKVRTTALRLPIVLDPAAGMPLDWRQADYGFYEPLLNVGALFAVEQGGIVPYTFTTIPQFHLFVLSKEGWKKFPPVPDRLGLGAAWRSAVDRGAREEAAAFDTLHAWFGSKFDDVLLYAPADTRVAFEQRGYETVMHEGKFSLLRFKGCPVRVALESDAPLPHDVVVDYGWVPLMDMHDTVRAPAGQPPAGGWLATEPARTPCGPTWARIFVDEDASGTLTAGDAVCAAAGRDGVVRTVTKPGAEVLRCESLRRW